jgi:putative selenium metabolism hydrolase
MNPITTELENLTSDLIEFARDLVRTRSISGDERAVIELIRDRMNRLDYDEVVVDSMGNLLGRMGTGKRTIMLDSHIDTVEAGDVSQWTHPPFSGVIKDGRLHGRGSVDMKSSAAAAVYAGALAKRMDLLEGKTVYVSCTVMEEDCDGENLKHLFREQNLKPDVMIICEPSGNKLAKGHKGKAQVAVKTLGISAHGSAPEKGVNAVYEMAGIIQRVEKLSSSLMTSGRLSGTLTASRITSKSESLNAVPFECELYLDRRMVMGETRDTLKREMDALVEGLNASWEIGVLHRKSWTGLDVSYHPFHLPWQIDLDHELTKACFKAFNRAFGSDPGLDYWDFSTNAVATVELGIPTIGFGPGEYKLAHMVNESCRVDQIADACNFYVHLMASL